MDGPFFISSLSNYFLPFYQVQAQPKSAMDDDTIRVLDSLNLEYLSGLDLTESLRIKLKETADYNSWVGQMKVFLDRHSLKGFIDGSTRDPDPKGEIQDGAVKGHSEKWKRADKLVMNWIMASLNDILVDMVKEIKTAKELWGSLVFLYSPDYDVTHTFSIKLKDEEGYNDWVAQMKEFLNGHHLNGFIDGSIRDPDPIRENQDRTVRGHSEKWKRADKQVMNCIMASLDDTVVDMVKEIMTAKEMLGTLETVYGPDYRYNDALNGVDVTSVVSIKLSGKKNYIQWATLLKCQMQFHGMLNLCDFVSKPPPVTFAKKHQQWEKANCLLKGWIFGSLAPDVIDQTLIRITNGNNLWVEIKKRHSPPDVSYTDLAGKYNHANYTELFTAIESGKLEATNSGLDRHGYNVQLNEDGSTPLHLIIETHQKDHYFENVLAHVIKLIDISNSTSTSASTPYNGASSSNSMTQSLVPKLVDLVNEHGMNTLHHAALVGKLNVAKKLVKNDPYLLFKEDKYQRLPIHVAILGPHKDTFRYLLNASKENSYLLKDTPFKLINPFIREHGVRLLNGVINAGYMEIAYHLIKYKPELASFKGGMDAPLYIAVKNFKKYYSRPISWRIFDHNVAMEFNATKSDGTVFPPSQEGTQRVEGLRNLVKKFNAFMMLIWGVLYGVYWWTTGETAERILPRFNKPDLNSLPEDEVKHNKPLLVIRSICNQVRCLSTVVEKRDHYRDPAILAAKEDICEALKELSKHFPETVWVKRAGYYLIELSVKHRCEKVYNFLANGTMYNSHFFKLHNKKDGNNLLHLAGKLAPIEILDKDSGAAVQMGKEFAWFQKVEKFALPGSAEEKNDEGDTPMMVFMKEHADLRRKGEEWMKTVANSYIIVAALINTITFAALITVPGGSQQDGSGLPVYIKNEHFRVFAVSDLVSFSCATISLVMFLSILTSRYTEEDFLVKLPRKLAFGLLTLSISLGAMLVAFAETFYLMFGHKELTLLIIMFASIGVPYAVFIYLQVKMIWKIWC